jgi:hypothetical protein
MPASNEKLLERINILKKYIDDVEERGEDPHSSKKELEKMIQQLSISNHQLNEGKSILKG